MGGLRVFGVCGFALSFWFVLLVFGLVVFKGCLRSLICVFCVGKWCGFSWYFPSPLALYFSRVFGRSIFAVENNQ